ncbi:MAG: type I secretion system permease/ATPase [Pseudomonadota bacterium]
MLGRAAQDETTPAAGEDEAAAQARLEALAQAAQPMPDDADCHAYLASPTLSLVKWCARHFGQPFSAATVANNLPDGFDGRDRAVLPRALARVGLRSSFVIRDLREIDPIVLPCILFRKTGEPLILTGFIQGRKLAQFIDPAEGDHAQEIPSRKLRKTVTKDVLFVTAEGDQTSRRMDPENRDNTASPRHWLWGPIRENSGAFFQILAAALGINLFALAVPIFVMNVYDRVIPNLAFVTLWTLAGGVAIALALDLILKLIRTNVLETVSRRIDLKIAATLFRQAMNVKLLDRPGGAAGMANAIRDFEGVRDFFSSTSFVAMIDLAFIGIFVAVLWFIVGPIALVPLLAVPIVIILALIAQIPIGNAVEKSQQLATKRHTVLVESLLGIETVKSLNSEPIMQKEWENAVAASARITGKTRFWSNFATSGTMLVQQGVSVFIILWGVYLVSDGQITVGGLIAANILAGRVLAPLGNISQTLIRAQHAFKSLGAISSVMALPVETAPQVASDLRVTKGSLEFRHITYTYPEAPQPALTDISFTIQPGECVGLLGRVGSGKSTTGKLFAGLLEADEGLILVDGQELAQYERAELRAGIGYLPQDPDLFSGTIRENLLLGRARATDAELNRALYLAGMDYFIAENPQGLDQYIGEKGNRLSGGQRQAIGLARLLLRRPKILFLDEPTNAMDNGTEAKVTARLAELKAEGVTLILCTHRQSLAAISDRLIVLDMGKKFADGPYKDVMAALTQNSQQSKQGPKISVGNVQTKRAAKPPKGGA